MRDRYHFYVTRLVSPFCHFDTPPQSKPLTLLFSGVSAF
ncbi:hypothetical protein VCRA2116O29_40079 [Vibrio crassostreae]|nr:hypothetical protein VCRA2116O29_40079 [Vibrio crassostreae]CAK2510032.1 hypothetical protein VCRA2119O48_40175 [Vibrio crassostreae]CAK3844178.1 hypothetical protein VCRA2123O74_40066 [Vibrio crassostreae]CAK3882681.1 hypothetical protein VCRA212O16_20065 [Vibrio crassostreae]